MKRQAPVKQATPRLRRDIATGSSAGRTFRSLTGGNGLVAGRRARRDIALLLTVVGLTATATVLAVTGPGLVLETVDGGVRDTLETAGSRADVTLLGSFATPRGENTPLTQFVTPESVLALEEQLPDRLPDALSRVVSDITLTVLSGDGLAAPRPDVPGSDTQQLRVRTSMLTPANTDGLTLVDGRMPEARAEGDVDPVEVVMSAVAADAASMSIGDVIEVEQLAWREQLVGESDSRATLELVGIIAAVDEGARVWGDTPELWKPLERPATEVSSRITRLTVLADQTGVAAVSLVDADPFEVRYRLHVDPAAFTSVLATQATEEIQDLNARDTALTGGTQVLDVRTELGPALAAYPQQARAALAQMSVMMSGVIGIAGIVVVLLSRLLVLYRAEAVALERARGASVLSVGMRTLTESAVTTVVGVGVGFLVALLLLGDAARDPLPVVVVAVVALLAGPVQSMSLARQAWTGRRDPANRRDRQRIIAARRARRIVVELAVVVIAIAALVSLRDRGLVQTRTDGVDPFLASAPILLAAAVTVVVLRVFPLPIRAFGVVGRQTRGVLGLLGAVRAQQSLAALPLLALTLGTALAVSGGLLVTTVREGQDEASWQRVGADIRIEGEVDGALVEALAGAAGVEAVGSSHLRGGVGLDLGTTGRPVTVIAIDGGHADVIDLLPSTPSSASLRELRTASPEEAVAVVVDATIDELLITNNLAMYYGGDYVPLEVVGTTDVQPTGYAEGPFVYVDLQSLSDYLPEPLPASTVLAIGSGAVAAAADLGVPEDTVLDRAGWIDDRRSLAIVSGVERTMLFAVGAVVLLAAVALIATVVSGARSRGRTLSLLRTLGMSPRLGWWLALSELAPLVIAAVLGGVVAGVAVVLALAPSLGLDVLAGGTTIPDAALSPFVPAGIAAGAIVLLLIGVLADVLVHRRDKLSEVLRVGETV